MKALIFVVLIAQATINAGDFKKYDAAAVRRFNDELRRLGVDTASLSEPGKLAVRPDPVVLSAAGDFEGYWTESQFGRPIAAFEGIPYAQPPVGPLRFKLAQPLMSRLTEFKAKEPGSKCVQRDFSAKTSDVEGNEDCLFVNVYVPEKINRTKSELLPVMFFVHGGGFSTEMGAANQCHILLDKDVVLVTFNYRLGTLGFLTTEDGVIPANLGLKDQVLALEWVHYNIAAFGGDPNLITVFGGSSGAACAEFLMMSPLTRGLIHGVIAMSGSSLAPWATAPPGEMKRNVYKVAQSLNCTAEPSQDFLSCLQEKTAQDITCVEFQCELSGLTPIIPFKPVIEGDIPGALLPRHPAKLFASGPANDVHFMTGVTSDEALFLVQDMFDNDTLIRELDVNFLEYCPESLSLTQPNEKGTQVVQLLRRAYFSPGPLSKENILEVSNLYSDVYFVWPAIKSEKYRRKGSKAPGYFYYFNYEGSPGRSFVPHKEPNESYGVCHGDDIFYLFNYTNHKIPPPSPKDVLMSMIWTDLFASFARDGVPSSNLIETKWLPVPLESSDTEYQYLHVKSPYDITMKKNFLPERIKLLESIFEPVQSRDEL